MITPPRQYPSFDLPVPSGGYCWWYADAVSHDGNSALTLIAFIGSVFSPYYFRAKKKPGVDPQNYCSLNVALYGQRGHRWTMTERLRDQVNISAEQFRIGPSSVSWQPGKLVFDINEQTVPLPSRIRGRVELDLHFQASHAFTLDSARRHYWWPVGACSSIKVDLSSPSLQWQGDAYTDMNWGSGPLERDIQYWCWSRHRQESNTYINYDIHDAASLLTQDPQTELALVIDERGQVSRRVSSPRFNLPNTKIWRMPRYSRGDIPKGDISDFSATHANQSTQQKAKPVVIQTVEDTPFYSRSLVETSINDQPCIGVHESLSLKRFCYPLVQAMLPFRMPRQILPLSKLRSNHDNAEK